MSIKNFWQLSTNYFKVVQTGFFESVISDSPDSTVVNSLKSLISDTVSETTEET